MDLRRNTASSLRFPLVTYVYVRSQQESRALLVLLATALFFQPDVGRSRVSLPTGCSNFRIFITKTGVTVETFHFTQANAKKRLTRRLGCAIIILVKNPIGGVASVIFTRQVNSTDHIFGLACLKLRDSFV